MARWRSDAEVDKRSSLSWSTWVIKYSLMSAAVSLYIVMTPIHSIQTRRPFNTLSTALQRLRKVPVFQGVFRSEPECYLSVEKVLSHFMLFR